MNFFISLLKVQQRMGGRGGRGTGGDTREDTRGGKKGTLLL